MEVPGYRRIGAYFALPVPGAEIRAHDAEPDDGILLGRLHFQVRKGNGEVGRPELLLFFHRYLGPGELGLLPAVGRIDPSLVVHGDLDIVSAFFGLEEDLEIVGGEKLLVLSLLRIPRIQFSPDGKIKILFVEKSPHGALGIGCVIASCRYEAVQNIRLFPHGRNGCARLEGGGRSETELGEFLRRAKKRAEGEKKE